MRSKTTTRKKIYTLYDSRYNFNPKNAIEYSTCDTLEEAKKEKEIMFIDAVIVEEEIELKSNRKMVIASKMV